MLAQVTPTAPPNNLTLDTLKVNGGITFGATTPKYLLTLPATLPTQNSLLGVQSVVGGKAQAAWVKGFNGTLRLSASCTVTVVNGLITGKVGGC